MRAPERSSSGRLVPPEPSTTGSNGRPSNGHLLGGEPSGGHLPNGHLPDGPRAGAGLDTEPTGHAANGSLLKHLIVTVLRRDGPASPDKLAARLGASRTGILQQLRALEVAELVTRQSVRHGVGRPRHVYDVTSDAQDLFPANYEGLVFSLLSAIQAVGGEQLISEVFAARRRQLAERVRDRFAEHLQPGVQLADRVRELAVLQDEQGYLCRAELDEGASTIRLRQHNCAIYRIAAGLPAACQAELELFRDVLGADVVRESHIVAGDRCCSYRISEPTMSSPDPELRPGPELPRA